MSLAFHHVGMVVHDAQRAADELARFGYVDRSIEYIDDRQGLRIIFALGAPPLPRLELVQPIGPTSVVRDLLTRTGASTYHLCFETVNLDQEIEALSESGYHVVAEPMPAPALDGRLFAFLYHRDLGLIEVIGP